MHRVLVDERKWIGEEPFLHALNFCMLLPGPEAMQLATYIGWRLHGVLGRPRRRIPVRSSGRPFVLALSLAYALFGDVPLVEAAFVGIKAAVLVIVIEALLKVAKRAPWRRLRLGSSPRAAFVALFFFDLPFPLVIAGAASLGYAACRPRRAPLRRRKLAVKLLPSRLMQDSAHRESLACDLARAACPPRRHLRRDHVFTDIALFFSKLAIVTFGGAYAVLAYMAQQAVETYGWLSAGEMLDGLGLAETTPGPLILVTEFVGFLAGYRDGGDPTLVFGLLGAVDRRSGRLSRPASSGSSSARPMSTGSARAASLQARSQRHGRGGRRHSEFEPVVRAACLLRQGRADMARTFAALAARCRDLDVKALVLSALSALLLLRLKLGIGATLAVSAAAALAWFTLFGVS